jgi:hypothetical protein
MGVSLQYEPFMLVAHIVACGGADPDDPAFFEAFAAFEARLNAAGLTLDNPAVSESEVQIVQTWPVREVEAQISIYDNHMADVRHIEIAAADDEILGRLTALARDTLPLEQHETLVDGWLGATINEPSVLVKIALSAPAQLSDSGFTALAEALGDPDPGVRCMAAYAIALNADPRFEPHLHQRLAIETDTNARNIIERGIWMYENV